MLSNLNTTGLVKVVNTQIEQFFEVMGIQFKRCDYTPLIKYIKDYECYVSQLIIDLSSDEVENIRQTLAPFVVKIEKAGVLTRNKCYSIEISDETLKEESKLMFRISVYFWNGVDIVGRFNEKLNKLITL